MHDFLIIAICVIITMVLCRTIPLLALKGRRIPEDVTKALNLIPPAAFAALVANDLLSPTMFDAGIWPGMLPLVAAVVVMVVGYKTKSLVWCIVAGCGCYALLTLI